MEKRCVEKHTLQSELERKGFEMGITQSGVSLSNILEKFNKMMLCDIERKRLYEDSEIEDEGIWCIHQSCTIKPENTVYLSVTSHFKMIIKF